MKHNEILRKDVLYWLVVLTLMALIGLIAAQAYAWDFISRSAPIAGA